MLRYTGREQDEANLYYYRARYYDPTIGRFLSEDPTGFDGGINFYAYVSNNPLIANDPFGWYTIIVHGTWAKGSDYVKPGAQFNNAVSETFGEQAHNVEWSGGNTVADRTEGAQILLRAIQDAERNNSWKPGEPLNIVAHSHGGNVVKEFSNFPARRGSTHW